MVEINRELSKDTKRELVGLKGEQLSFEEMKERVEKAIELIPMTFKTDWKTITDRDMFLGIEGIEKGLNLLANNKIDHLMLDSFNINSIENNKVKITIKENKDNTFAVNVMIGE